MARTTIATPGFLDRLGDRVVVADRNGTDLEVLRLRPELASDPAFEPCLKARAEQLSTLQHRNLARVRGVSRLPSPDGRLAIVSDAVKGWRLSEILQAIEQGGRVVHTSAVLFLLRQVASSLAAMQAVAPDVAHAALGPERVVVVPGGRVLVVEYVLGSALARLPALPADRVWKDLRLAVPVDAEAERFGPATDVLQLGIVALSLVHNRLLRRDEYPGRLAELVETANESQLVGDRQPIGPNLKNWLSRALRLAPEAPAWTIIEAQQGLDWLVSAEGGYLSTPVGLEPLLQWVAQFFAAPMTETPRTGVALASAPAAPEPPATTPAPEPVAAPLSPPPDPPPTPSSPIELADDAADAPGRETIEAPLPAPTVPAFELVEPQPAAMVQPLGAEPVSGTAASVADAEDDQLVVRPSPLAEFAAERSPEAPSASAAALAPPARADAPWPAPPPRPDTSIADALPADVSTVADMLSFGPSVTQRRPGRRSEPWVSGPDDRQTAAQRVAHSDTAPSARSQKSNAAPVAAKSGDAAGTFAKPSSGVSSKVESEVPRAASSSSFRLQPDDKPAARSGALHGADAEKAPTSGSFAGGPRTAGETLPAAMPSRTLFGASDESLGEEREEASGNPLTKWIAAAAAVLILGGGGFFAWRYFKTPSAPPAASAVAAKEQPPATPAPAVSTPAAAPKESPPVAQAPPAVPAVSEASAAEARPANGLVEIVSVVKLNILEKGEQVGTSGTPFPLPVGRHVLDLANDELGVRVSRIVEVRAGRPLRIEVPAPRGSMNINATPWAEVFIDNQRVGETPLANLQLAVGSHEVRFRHPQLGEQVRTIVVSAGTPGRLSVDMKQ